MNDMENTQRQRRLARGSVVLIAVIGVLVLVGMGSKATRSNWPTQFQSNGERIYFTARSASDLPINTQGGTMHMRMMATNGGGCVTCHGVDRQGGRLMPRFRNVVPPLTPEALFEEHEEDGHGDHGGYTDETLRRAIFKGIDAGGKPLAQEMPRWSMSEQDINDLIGFLRSPDGGRSH